MIQYPQQFQYTCPTCKKKTEAPGREDLTYRPFCSARCRWIDLGKWMNGEYRISDPLDGADSGFEPFSSSELTDNDRQ